MKRALTILICTAWVLTGLAAAQVSTGKSMPPSVVKSVPQSGATGVDAAATKEISVTFSKDMTDLTWSLVMSSADTFPKLVGKPRYLEDKRTCVVDVELEPHKKYVIWLNSEKFKNFKDAEGTPAIPYLLEFQTK